MGVRANPSWTAVLAAAAVAMAAHGAIAGCAGTPPCERNSDCVRGYCDDGECKQDCVDSELDCPTGTFCNDVSQCEPIGSGGSGGSAGSGGTGGSGGTAGSGGSGGTAGTGGTGGTGGAPGTMLELELCGSDGDCVSGLVCRAMVKAGSMRCTRTCASDDQCMTGTRCQADGSGTSCLGSDVGRFCSSADHCNYGCIQGPNYCTAACGTGSDCPNGYGCMPIGSPAQRVCVKAEAYCNVGDTAACIAPSACDTSPNLIIAGCTLACDTAADCPRRAAPMASWSCDGGGVCRRPADVYGSLPGGYDPVEYHCDAQAQPVNLCNDAQHMNFIQFTVPPPPSVDCQSQFTTPGAQGDACVNSCRYQGGCSFGFECVAVGAVGNDRMGLCLPGGGGEVGTVCAHHTDCVFGYCVNGLCSRDCTEDAVCPGPLQCVAGGAPAVEGVPFRRCE